MSPRRGGRTQSCSVGDAGVRSRHARAFLDTGELVSSVDDELANPNVAAALAVLAGIAASDAICCVALGERSRGQDHRQAIDLLNGVESQGRDWARDLARLLDIKDGAQYGHDVRDAPEGRVGTSSSPALGRGERSPAPGSPALTYLTGPAAA